MVAYGIAKARAMANRTDWNERTEITKAVITWFDADYEYELEIENEDRMDNEAFTAWVEENAESLVKADAEENGTTFEEIDGIDFTEKEIDDDALFDEEYENACEFEWVTPHGVKGQRGRAPVRCARPDGNPKPTIQDQSPERGCGSYSLRVAPVRRGFVSSECFSLSHKCPTQGGTRALVSLVYDTQESAEIPSFFLYV